MPGEKSPGFFLTKRILDYDPMTRITTTFDYYPETDTTVLYREQDNVHLILDANKSLQNDDDYTKKGIKEEWWHYATYPNIIIEKWLNEFGVNVYDKDHQKKVFELVNRPEYRYLKTTTKMHRG